MSLGLLIIKALYFFLPAYFANMAPEFVKKLPFLGQPIWKKKLGKNKTWRGILAAVILGTLIFLLQKLLFPLSPFNQISLIDYSDFSLLLGFLLSLGAILGDSVKSFFKRRRKIKPGQSWKPWDQLDFTIGALVLSWFVYVPKIEVAMILLILSFFLHILFCRFGCWLKIKKTKF